MSSFFKYGIKFPVFFLLLLTIILSSCTEFFTTSLAPWAARNPNDFIPPVNSDNVDTLIRDFENDPDASLVILDRISDALENAPEEEIPYLQAAALEAAVNSVGLVSAVLTSIPDIELITDVDAAIEIVNRAINSMSNLEAAGSLLVNILPEPNTQAFEDFVNAAEPVDLAFAAVVILAGEAKNADDLEEYLSNYINKSDSEKTDAEKTADALAISVVNSVLEDFLIGLGLIDDRP